jgi:hypothetical protein
LSRSFASSQAVVLAAAGNYSVLAALTRELGSFIAAWALWSAFNSSTLSYGSRTEPQALQDAALHLSSALWYSSWLAILPTTAAPGLFFLVMLNLIVNFGKTCWQTHHRIAQFAFHDSPEILLSTPETITVVNRRGVQYLQLLLNARDVSLVEDFDIKPKRCDHMHQSLGVWHLIRFEFQH